MNRDRIQDEIISEFSAFDSWLDRYDHLIGLGKAMPAAAIPANRMDKCCISGCQSRVWIDAELREGRVWYSADSDTVITKGIISLLMRVYNGSTPEEILGKELYFIDAVGLSENLSPMKANGLAAMLQRMKLFAESFHSDRQPEQSEK